MNGVHIRPFSIGVVDAIHVKETDNLLIAVEWHKKIKEYVESFLPCLVTWYLSSSCTAFVSVLRSLFICCDVTGRNSPIP